ncbi:MAG: non-canonical purine NTP pyrophosphatase, RdgB/HAM1 family [Anaerolinea sp.]|nr:non-canonical purine NTP pyrophosphatase, RdgB/HAM1 family [Anaerolinea sp.]
MKICLATENKGKVIEMQTLLGELPLTVCTAQELGIDLAVAETGASYHENAYLKASAYAWRSGLPALGDDSGLEVAALDGAPGLYSNRFAPIANPTDADRRAYLLSCLVDKPHPWLAFFTCTICVCLPNGRHWFFTGRCDGEVIPAERGSNGFGYDPIFLMAGQDHTMAELSDEEKNRVSHRARAMVLSIPTLLRLVDNWQGR